MPVTETVTLKLDGNIDQFVNKVERGVDRIIQKTKTAQGLLQNAQGLEQSIGTAYSKLSPTDLARVQVISAFLSAAL